MLKKVLIVLATLFLLTGCTIFSPVKVKPTTLYVLDTLGHPPVVKTHRRIAIFVAEPQANAIYNTQQMAYSIKPHQIGYFALNRWAEPSPEMLQPLIVQTLHNTHYFIAPRVGNAHQYSYMLNTELLELRQVFTDNSSYVNFKLRAYLTKVSSGKIIATKQFSTTVAAPERTPYGGVIAANQATSAVLTRLAIFCLQQTGAPVAVTHKSVQHPKHENKKSKHEQYLRRW